MGWHNVSPEDVEKRVRYLLGEARALSTAATEFTQRSRKVVEFAIAAARRQSCPYIGTQHFLLGLIGEGEGVAAGILAELGVTLAEVKEASRDLQPSLVTSVASEEKTQD